MDPMTQFAAELWQTPETIHQIWERLGWLNLNLAITNALLGVLIVALRTRKDGTK